MSSKDRVPDALGLRRGIKPVVMGVLVGVAVCIIVLLVFSFVLTTQNVPQALVGPMANMALSVGALAAGYACARKIREQGLLWGLVCGVVLSFVMLLASLGLSENGFGMPALFKIVFILICSMLGGVLGVNTRKKRKGAKR